MRQPRRQPIRKQYKYPHEVFAEVCKIESFHDRVAYLRENASFSVKTILQCNFNVNIVLDLPEGAPPYKEDKMPPDLTPGRIDKAINVLGKLVKREQNSSTLQRVRKESLFINLLESISHKDAEIIIAIKDKKLTSLYPAIDEILMRAACPELL